MTLSIRLVLGLLTLIALPATPAGTADQVRNQCGSCHQLAPPAADDAPPTQAPPLYYAGNKFQRQWLEGWLQEPQRLRPAGYYPPAHVEQGNDGNVIDAESLPAHPALSADQAVAVAEYLMTLTARDDLVAADDYQPGSVHPRMGMMDFRKFKGCNACHQDRPGEGGVSGPELHSAWQRLQPAYLSSYLQRPTAWDPHSMMPAADMGPAAAHKLVNYLKAIGGQSQ